MSAPQTFWEHLDELRGSLIKMAVAVLVCTLVAFCFKTEIFAVLLAPSGDGFITYQLLDTLAREVSSTTLRPLDVQLINTGLAHQFLLHVKAAFSLGMVAASPYIVYLLFHFVAPALYRHERRYGLQLVVSGYVMFLLGVLLSYFLIFPLTFRFLGSYQVSEAVANTVTLASYLETLLVLSLSMGLVFEIPVLCRILGKMGWINSRVMVRYRRHVIVVLLLLAAIITPTSDAFTLLLVALPMWLLYEVSILVVKAGAVKKTADTHEND